MLARVNLVLLLVFGGLLVFYLTDRDRFAGLGASPTISLELFPEFRALDADRVVVRDPSREVELVRSGEDWMMASSGNYPVAKEKIERLLEKLETLQKGTVASRNADSFERLQVDGNNREVLVYGEAEEPIVHFYIGRRGAGNRRTFLRKDGADEALAVLDQDLNKIFTATPFAWFENLDILKFDSKLAVELTVEGPTSRVVFQRDEKGDWTQVEPLGLDADQVRVVGVVRAMAQLQFSDVASPDPDRDFGFDRPAVTAKISLSDDTSYAITAGALTDDGAFRYLRKDGDDTIYKVAARNFDRVFIASATEWLVTPGVGSGGGDRTFTGPPMGGALIGAMMRADAVVDATALATAIDEDGKPIAAAEDGDEWISVPFEVSAVLKGEDALPQEARAGAAPLTVQLPAGRQLPDLAPAAGVHLLFLEKTDDPAVMRLTGDPVDTLIQPTAQTRASMAGVLQQMKNAPKPPAKPPEGAGQ